MESSTHRSGLLITEEEDDDDTYFGNKLEDIFRPDLGRTDLTPKKQPMISNPNYSSWLYSSGGPGRNYDTIEEENEEEEAAQGGGSRDHRRRRHMKYKSLLPKCLLDEAFDDDEVVTASGNVEPVETSYDAKARQYSDPSQHLFSKDTTNATSKVFSSEEMKSESKLGAFQDERKSRTHLSHSFCGVIAREPEEQKHVEASNWRKGPTSQLKVAYSENLIAKNFRNNGTHRQAKIPMMRGSFCQSQADGRSNKFRGSAHVHSYSG